jgi:hypothetical protein
MRFWRNHEHRDVGAWHERDVGEFDARLRVGQRSRQRLSAGRAVPDVDDGREQRSHIGGLRFHIWVRDGDALF